MPVPDLFLPNADVSRVIADDASMLPDAPVIERRVEPVA
jgi:hypothetical protein